MSPDRHFGQQALRGTDSNSLLRLFDEANHILQTSDRQLERERAGKAVLRISKELQRRKITPTPGAAMPNLPGTT